MRFGLGERARRKGGGEWPAWGAAPETGVAGAPMTEFEFAGTPSSS